MRERGRTTAAERSAPDVAAEQLLSEKRSPAAALSTSKLSKSGRTRRRKLLRTFYWGMRCSEGPPGLATAEEGAGSDPETFRMNKGDTDEEDAEGTAQLQVYTEGKLTFSGSYHDYCALKTESAAIPREESHASVTAVALLESQEENNIAVGNGINVTESH